MKTLQLMILSGCLIDIHFYASEYSAFKPYKKGKTTSFQKLLTIDSKVTPCRKRSLSCSEEQIIKKRELMDDINFENFHIDSQKVIEPVNFVIINQLGVDNLARHSQDLLSDISINLSTIFQSIEVINKTTQSQQLEFDLLLDAVK